MDLPVPDMWFGLPQTTTDFVTAGRFETICYRGSLYLVVAGRIGSMN